jgi:hypothetical protein
MQGSSSSSAGSLSNAKADPFAIADLDRLADEISTEIERVAKESGIDLSPVAKLAAEMKAAAASVTEFFINQV